MDQVIVQAKEALLVAKAYATNAYTKASPYIEKGAVAISKTANTLLPHYKQARQVVLTQTKPIMPYVNQGYAKLVPVFLLLQTVQSRLPTFPGVPLNQLGIAVILLHILNYNLTSFLEYKTKLFTRVLGPLAIYVYALFLIAVALVRDHYLVQIIEADAGTRVVFDAEVADILSFWLITYGIFLNFWTLQTTGFKRFFNGDCFGHVHRSPITDGPFQYLDDPQYLGSACTLLGYAVRYQSRIGYGLTGIMYLAFSFSSMFLEGPLLRSIIAEHEKKDPSSKKLKAKKTN